MIQRKQTLFLLIALIVTIACLYLPLGSIEPNGMGVSPVLFNLGVKGQGIAFDFGYVPLFILLVLTCPISIITILLYKRRKLQSKLCVGNIIIDILWYAYLGYCWVYEFSPIGDYHPNLVTVLPLISIILYVMARRGILRDERLVRAADRIR